MFSENHFGMTEANPTAKPFPYLLISALRRRRGLGRSRTKIERKWFWRTAHRVERGESGAVVLRELPLNSPSGELVQNYHRLSPWRACAQKAHTLDSTHFVRSSLFHDFENESELGKTNAQRHYNEWWQLDTLG